MAPKRPGTTSPDKAWVRSLPDTNFRREPLTRLPPSHQPDEQKKAQVWFFMTKGALWDCGRCPARGLMGWK